MIEQEPSSMELDVGLESSKSEFGDTFQTRPIGEYLRRQRILRGISSEELASMTRIPLRSLERLESGQFDGDTDGFVRGFVRTVAAALGLDVDDAISRMLAEPEPSAWDRRASGRGVQRGFVGVALFVSLVVTAFVLRAGWNVLLGEASTPGSREVIFWHDPVRALAEATGIGLDADGELDSSVRSPVPDGSPSKTAAGATANPDAER